MAPLAERLAGRVPFAHVADADAARDMLLDQVRPGDAILVKGSNSVGLSRVVAALAARKRVSGPPVDGEKV